MTHVDSPLPQFSNMFPPEITVYKAGSLVSFPLIHFSTYLDVLLGITLYYFFIFAIYLPWRSLSVIVWDDTLE